jgi:hypothetical protein
LPDLFLRLFFWRVETDFATGSGDRAGTDVDEAIFISTSENVDFSVKAGDDGVMHRGVTVHDEAAELSAQCWLPPGTVSSDIA